MAVEITFEREVPYKEYDPTAGDGPKYKWAKQKITVRVTAEKADALPDMYVAALKGLENGQKKHAQSFKRSSGGGGDFD